MLFCEGITDVEALSALKGGLDMNLPFWRDVHNKNPTTFDQLVEMIRGEITNENMILHRNRGGVAPNRMPRINYGRNQGRQLPQPLPRRRDYPADPNSGISYVASAQEGLLPPYPVQMAPVKGIAQKNAAKWKIWPTDEKPVQEQDVEETRGTGYNPRCIIVAHRVLTDDPSNGIGDHPTKIHREEVLEARQGSHGQRERPSTVSLRAREASHPRDRYHHGGPYIGGQSRNAQKSYAKEAEGKLMTNWLINNRPSSSSKVDPISFTEEEMRGVHYPHCDSLVVRAVVSRNGLGRMLVDNGSSVNVIFSSTYEQMNIVDPLEPSTEPLYGFTGYCVTPKGIVRLAVMMGEEPMAVHTFMEFLIVDRRSAYH
ncbi:Uncharacterized protein Adt_23060 [Abeliophyllum distichum]|uniref:Uncharacterized protein n=1 Tax=Abeliophyllum distichum TaxID=126358 RepID=A0ABD1S9Z4_9LAMI